MKLESTNMNKEIKKYFSDMGKRSANKLTPEQRKERANKAVEKRWSNYKLKKENE